MVELAQTPNQKYKTVSPEEQLQDAMAAFKVKLLEQGLEPPTIEPSGKLVRFDINRSGDKAGWYFFYSGKVCGGVAGNWKNGVTIKWRSESYKKLSIEQKAEFNRRQQERLQRIEKERTELYERASVKYTALFENSKPASKDHPYFLNKCVGLFGDIRQDMNKLLIPVKDETGKIWTLQEIYPDGSKYFAKGGRVRGGSFTIPGNDKIYIVEGYATGATVHKATDGTVVVAFNGGNLQSVARLVRGNKPNALITICGDDDRFN